MTGEDVGDNSLGNGGGGPAVGGMRSLKLGSHPPAVIPVFAQRKTATHARRMADMNYEASPWAALPATPVFMGPGQPLRGFRDDGVGGGPWP
jgi:hypothetical protein